MDSDAIAYILSGTVERGSAVAAASLVLRLQSIIPVAGIAATTKGGR
jgi:hypothetical protein